MEPCAAPFCMQHGSDRPFSCHMVGQVCRGSNPEYWFVECEATAPVSLALYKDWKKGETAGNKSRIFFTRTSKTLLGVFAACLPEEIFGQSQASHFSMCSLCAKLS